MSQERGDKVLEAIDHFYTILASKTIDCSSDEMQEAIDHFYVKLMSLAIDCSSDEVQEAIDHFYTTFAPMAREMRQNTDKLQEKIRLIEELPLPERLLAWSEWNRMCRPPLTGNATTSAERLLA